MSCLINYSKVMDLVLDTDYLIEKLTAMKFKDKFVFICACHIIATAFL